MLIDTSTEFGARVERRLRDEEVIWLTTIDGDRRPQPSPVWFLWDGETMLIYSETAKPKVRNIAANPHVALNFDSDDGDNIVIFSGEAQIVDDAPSADHDPAYLAKYGEAIKRIGHSPETFAAQYSVEIRVRPTKVRGF